MTPPSWVWTPSRDATFISHMVHLYETTEQNTGVQVSASDTRVAGTRRAPRGFPSFIHTATPLLSLNKAPMGFVLFVPLHQATHAKSQGEFLSALEGTGIQVTENLSSSTQPSIF